MSARKWRFENPVVILAALALLTLPELVQAQYECTTNAGKITITGYTGAGGAVIIPGTITDLPVVSIGDSAFRDCSSLTSVTIPASVVGIEYGAFEGCSSLASITIPAGVVSIGEWAFSSCRQLARVTIPDGVVSIGSYAFNDCVSLAGITLPASLTSMGAYAFSGCWKIADVTIPASVAYIGAGAFGYCRSLTSITVNAMNAHYSSSGGRLFNKTRSALVQYPAGRLGPYAIPNGITHIKAWAFNGCAKLTSVSIPASLTNFEQADPFYDCSSLTSITVKAANNFYSSADGVLFNKAKTTLLLCPKGKAGACTIPDGVIGIETGAFRRCMGLTRVSIPASVTNVAGISPFSGCVSLASITVSATNTAYCSVGGVLFDKARKALIRHPANKSGSYTIPPGVARIEAGAFGDCSRLTSIAIPASVTNIVAEYAFGGCSSLSAITVNGTNPSYCSVDGVLFDKDQSTLLRCPGGKAGSYTIPASVTRIGAFAFAGDNGLASVTISAGITNIGEQAFEECTNLATVCFQGNAPSIKWLVFHGDNQATIYYLPGATGWTNPWGDRPTVGGSPPGQLCFAASAYSAQEGALCTVRVKRVFGSSGTVSVTCVMKAVTANGLQDYTAKTNTLTWTDGQTDAKAFVIPIRVDGKSEGAETFQVMLKNPVGATLTAPFKTTVTILANTKGVSSGATVALTQKDSLAEALDGEGLSWLTSTKRPWTKQPFVTVDGEDAAISGAAALDRVSWLQTDVEGPGTLTYDWLVKGNGLDTCLLLVDGHVRRTRIPGHDWAHETLAIDEGAHIIRWVFIGDTGLAPGAAYLDQVTWTPE